MASSINASTSGGGGVIVTSDATGNLDIQSGGSTVVAVTSAGVAVTGTLAATGASTFTGTGKFATTIGVGNATPAASGSGITFPATQSASSDANTLDDYEEGTWTPTFRGTTGATGQVYSVQVGTYTKVGRIITCTFNATLTTLGTLTGGEMCIGGLPFTSNSTANYYGANGSFGLLSNLSSARSTLTISVEPNTNIAYVMGNAAASTSPYGYNGTALWTATSAAWGSFTYLTA